MAHLLHERIVMEYLNKIKELSIPIVESHNKVLIDTVLRKEFGISVISIIIDDPKTFTLDIDEVAEINTQILDVVNDLIPDGFYLEVTSLGIERELKTDDDFKRAIGKYVYIKTYQKLPDVFDLKEIEGDLLDITDNEYILSVTNKTRTKEVKILKTAVSKIRLAVDFRRK